MSKAVVDVSPWCHAVRAYDAVASRYDEAFRVPPERAASERWFGWLNLDASCRLLDVGCGTGMLVDHRHQDLDPERYVGIDPSGAMLAEFRKKQPAYACSLICTSFEDYLSLWEGPGFDRIAAMFGVASYIRCDFVAGVRALLRPGGIAYLMYYDQPRTPSCYGKLGFEVPADLIRVPPAEAVRHEGYAVMTIEI